MDIDGDGILDILSGSYSRYEPTMAGLFQVLKGQPGHKFLPAAELKGTDGEPLIIPIKDQNEQTHNICTRPTAVDWTGDGHLDLVVGNFTGTFYLFTGSGGGKFAPKPEPILADGKPLRVEGAHSDPFVIDWDRDGDLDIVSGATTGAVYWSENTARKGQKPTLKPFVAVIKPATTVAYGEPLTEEQLTGPVGSSRVWVDDVNGDGKMDVLVGDTVTLTAPAKGLTAAEFKKMSEQWQEDFRQATQVNANDPANAEKLNRSIQELYQRRAKFVKEERTGFVWLYQGK